MTNTDIGRWLASELDKVTVHHHDLSFGKLKAAYAKVKAQALALQQTERLAIRRCVADRVLMAAIDTGRSERDCMHHFRSLARLGFADMATECRDTIILARYLIDIGSQKNAYRLLERLQQKCIKTLRHGDQKVLRIYLTTINELIKSANGK
jgi:hypothetical protein